jgi:hypothetical protein
MAQSRTNELDLVSSREASVMLAVSNHTVNRWVHDGVLTPALKGPGLRGVFMFHRADVTSLAKQRLIELRGQIEKIESAAEKSA